MKPKLLTSILLFISAYSPLFLILVVKDFNFEEKTIASYQPNIVIISGNRDKLLKSDSILIAKLNQSISSNNTQQVSTQWKFNHPVFDTVVIIISILSIIMLFYVMKKMERGSMIVTIKDVKNRSLDIINYIIPYLFCAFDIDTSKPEDIITVGFFLIILLILTLNTQSIFINPILALNGYAFYDIEYEYDSRTKSTIVISKNDLHTGNRFYIRSLTRFLYFVKQEENNNTNAV